MWDPTVPGQHVRLKHNPGKQGETTGSTRVSGTRLLVQVAFGSADRTYKNYDQLELCKDEDDLNTLFKKGRFGGPEDLRRILTLEKIKGHLTNIFYSMETSQTDFYPHQFKPILKFLNSTNGRIIIADEVGLGKTIEAMYVWKELQVREQARCLLIVCPAMLRQKWQDDLRTRFNISADIVSTKELVAKLESSLDNPQPQPFVFVTGLEGLRKGLGNPADWEDPNNIVANARLARLLDSYSVSEGYGLFDLVIIDEAHYLRNSETAGHKLGRLLRDASRHLLLLTATPIQTHSKNLYNLLRLIDQDSFPDNQVFEEMILANRSIVMALRYLWNNPPNIEEARSEISQALKSKYLRGNELLNKIRARLEKDQLTEEDRIELGYKLEKISLLGQYISRSRKRDVLSNRVKRRAQTLTVNLSPLERKIYDDITYTILQKCKGKQGTALFTLITRQRQMTSCMAAALQTWKDTGILDDLASVEDYLCEDLSFDSTFLYEEGTFEAERVEISISDRDLKTLRTEDSKYQELVSFLKRKLAENPNEKFVIFAYFRATLNYLQKRLAEDDIDASCIMGDMGDAKWDTVEHFRQANGPSILLSSEVGSEGIDLQHCRFVVNYDLPWNPMRVEQRIGRIDRLGQTSESISIVNFSLIDTIEERVLDRLYKRINIFEESIGDLEDILGPMTEQLIIELFQRDLTKAEQDERLLQTADAIMKQRQLTDELESEASSTFAFSDYILSAIQDSKEQKRWLQPEELKDFVTDYFRRYYPGTQIYAHDDSLELFDISLSEEAKKDFRLYQHQNLSAIPTRLWATQVICFFDPKAKNRMGKGYELIEPTHPLIQWIRIRYESGEQSLYPLSAIRLESEPIGLEKGLYVFVAQRWTFIGLKTESQIAYRIAHCSNGKLLPARLSERAVMTAIQSGGSQPNAINLIDNLEHVLAQVKECEECIDVAFGEKLEEFDMENESRCEIQRRSAGALAERKRMDVEGRIERIRASGDASKARILPALEGKLKKIQADFDFQNGLIDKKSDPSFDQNILAMGVLFVI
jgi:superfamily II DNA or RNA helicase